MKRIKKLLNYIDKMRLNNKPYNEPIGTCPIEENILQNIADLCYIMAYNDKTLNDLAEPLNTLSLHLNDILNKQKEDKARG